MFSVFYLYLEFIFDKYGYIVENPIHRDIFKIQPLALKTFQPILFKIFQPSGEKPRLFCFRPVPDSNESDLKKLY